MSKGFLVFAKNSNGVDYIEQAYALALSIKNSQTAVKKISLVTDDVVPDNYVSIFDRIIPTPFDTTTDSRFKAEHRWKLYYASPYDETIVLDTDMLMLDDISLWWDHCSHSDIKFCSRIKNYKDEVVVDTVHRRTFIENKLSNPYFALHYFKKSETAYEFYKVLEFVVNNWEWCWTKFAPEEYQDWVSMDLATAIAIEITGLHEEVLDTDGPLEFVHMKAPLQGWKLNISNWQDAIFFNFSNELTLSNIRQNKLFHYVEKDFLTTPLINRLKELVNG